MSGCPFYSWPLISRHTYTPYELFTLIKLLMLAQDDVAPFVSFCMAIPFFLYLGWSIKEYNCAWQKICSYIAVFLSTGAHHIHISRQEWKSKTFFSTFSAKMAKERKESDSLAISNKTKIITISLEKHMQLLYKFTENQRYILNTS